AGEEAGQRVDRREPHIAGYDTVAPFRLQMEKEALDARRVEIGQIERLDATSALARDEAQQHDHCIPVAVHGVLAHAPLVRQIVFEEGDDRSAQRRDLPATAHDGLPEITSANRAAKRSLASTPNSSRHCR